MRRFIFILILSLVITTGSQAASSSGEYQVKAAYIYNFAKFIHWPDSAFSDDKAPLVIGVLGTNDFNGELKPLVGKKVRNRIIKVKYFNTLREVKNCQLLYISKSEEENLQQILKKLTNQAILTVGETKYFVEYGGIIQFVTKRDRLRFSINQDIAQNNGIQIEAQLLSLAAKVVKGQK